jgi:hypothetical protein
MCAGVAAEATLETLVTTAARVVADAEVRAGYTDEVLG